MRKEPDMSDDRQNKRQRGRPSMPVKLLGPDGQILEFESQTKAAGYLEVPCQRIWLSLKTGIKVKGFRVQKGELKAKAGTKERA